MEAKDVGAPVPSNTGLASKLAANREAIAAAHTPAAGAVATEKAAVQKVFKQMTSQTHRPTKPKLAPGEVLFVSARSSLGCQFSATKTIRFVDGYYATADTAEIAFLRKNAEHFNVTESK